VKSFHREVTLAMKIRFKEIYFSGELTLIITKKWRVRTHFRGDN